MGSETSSKAKKKRITLMEKRIEMYDKILVNDIKNSLEDWLTTHGEITMGSEMTEDVNRIIDEAVERRMRIRQDWMLPDRC
tara:strand:- start:1388 stop:1630 length:243 start_codon:yes stop_codon:yes gene_type:complete